MGVVQEFVQQREDGDGVTGFRSFASIAWRCCRKFFQLTPHGRSASILSHENRTGHATGQFGLALPMAGVSNGLDPKSRAAERKKSWMPHCR
jgi:hypothetical protein